VSAEEKRHVDREMTRGLCTALDAVIAGGPGPRVFEAARNVAQLLVLPGLDRLLAVMAAHPVAVMPPEQRHALDRLRRERDRAYAQSSLVSFYQSDRELAALASHLDGLDWKAASAEAPAAATPQRARESVIGFKDALGGGRYADEASEAAAGQVRLTSPVAAVLRAALDWLFGDPEQRAPLRVSEDGGTFEVECRGVDPGGLLAAHEVIASVGGSLNPAQNGDRGAWVLRLPAVAERELFLMLQQSDLRLALPWSNVLRIQLETAEGEPLAAPPLAPLRPLTGARRGRPVVTVGLGLRRGSLAVDRLVWRLAAEPSETEDAVPPGTTRAVCTDDGEQFWVIDVARLMRDVPLPQEPGEPESSTAETPAPPMPAPPLPAARVAPGAAPPRLILLHPDNVQPIDDMPAPGVTINLDAPPKPPTTQDAPAAPAQIPGGPSSFAPPARPLPAARPRLSAAPEPGAIGSGHARRALIAEDSFMARIFLMRLLHAQGYNVHSVGNAQELRDALAGGTWALVCVDTDLPDARGAALLREVSDTQLEQTAPAVVVALVCDWTDQQQAAEGGVHRVLLKPFSQREVVALLERAGLPVAGPR
jgi:CheY-like chemotaxis protein